MARTWFSTAILATALLSLHTLAKDFIIVGAGTCGLVLANRLSADPANTVTLIEAGPDERNNVNITDPQAPGIDGGPLDWAYASISQPGLASRNTTYKAGRLVGGTSMLNGMMYVRPDAEVIDAWERLGAKRWNWRSLWPYYLQAENFTAPTEAQQESLGIFDARLHGKSGDVDVCYPYELANGTFPHLVESAWNSLSFPTTRDANGGRVAGFFARPMTIQRESGERESVASAFFYGIDDRPNLKLIQGTVTKILRHHTRHGELVAKGVEYIDVNGSITTELLHGPGEVILSAGSLRSPTILEAYVIGKSALLQDLGVGIKVALPGVGENLQDQMNCGMAYTTSLNVTGITPYATFVTAKQLFEDYTQAMAEALRKDLVQDGTTAMSKALQTHLDLFFTQNVSVAELTTGNANRDGQGLIYQSFWPLLPFSRGSVHLRSTKTADIDNPIIDPKFLSLDFDLPYLIATARLARSFYSADAVSHLNLQQYLPSILDLPENATDTQWEAYLKGNCKSSIVLSLSQSKAGDIPGKTNYHPVGTTSMMSRDLGGVVDPELKVYGTKNVRVVDAGVLPMQLNGHMVATLYAVAAWAAEIILKTREGDVASLANS